MNSYRITDELKRLPFLKLNSPITNIPHLTDLDADLQLPYQNNFDYFTVDDFKNNEELGGYAIARGAFSALHCNIRSLPANYDNLLHMLQQLDYPFSIIGLSETKF